MRSKLLAASLLAGLLPLAASAGPIYGEFTATVWGVDRRAQPFRAASLPATW